MELSPFALGCNEVAELGVLVPRANDAERANPFSQGTHAMNRRESLKLLAGSAALAAAGGLFVPRIALAQAPDDGPFKLPPLGYAYEALEPHIDAQTMMLHHDKHHAAYVQKCNEFAKTVPELGTTPVEKTLLDPAYLPLQIQKQVKDNLGGHWNHTFFWQLMTPGGPNNRAASSRQRSNPNTAISRSSRNASMKLARPASARAGPG
jgi:hypothetical protein